MADRILLPLLVLIGVALTLYIYRPDNSGDAVLEVRQNGTVLMRLSLDEDRTEDITGEDGQENHFRIEDGTVTMTDANCQDRTCVKTQGIRTKGQTIVCLPHRLVLAITDDDTADEAPDAIVR